MTSISVIVCTHNPRQHYLDRVIRSLKEQTFARRAWELLIVDNASPTHLADVVDLSWHGNARHVREEKLGLTQARLRGIAEAKGSLLIFVDDDNVLAADYLAVAKDIADSMPWIGAFNGSTIGEYEVPLPDWAEIMPVQLAVRDVSHVAWACLPGTRSLPFAPCGAGMVIRRTVAEHYAAKVRSDSLRASLGRKGGALMAAEDTDMAFCACEIGFAVGVFPELSLVHLIPKERLDRAYFLRLAEGMAFSHAILRFLWDGEMPPPPCKPCRSARIFNTYTKFRAALAGRRNTPTFADEWAAVTNRGIQTARTHLLSIVSGSAQTDGASHAYAEQFGAAGLVPGD